MPFHFHSSKKELEKSILLNFGFAFIEAFFGIIANSTALVSDAMHDLSDTVSLGLSWYGQKKAERGSTKQYTFGFYRFSVIAAVINSIVLLFVSAFIFWNAYQRFLDPEPVNGLVIFGVAIVGVIVNGMVVLKLNKHKEDISTRSAMWHMMEDFLGWIAFLVGGVIMIFTDFTWIDPLLSVIVGLFVLYGAFTILSEALNILSEGVPKDIDLDEVKGAIGGVDQVKSVHDVHIWTLGAGVKTLSCHVQLPNMYLSNARYVMDEIEDMLKKSYHIQHATIEVETDAKTCQPGKKCD